MKASAEKQIHSVFSMSKTFNQYVRLTGVYSFFRASVGLIRINLKAWKLMEITTTARMMITETAYIHMVLSILTGYSDSHLSIYKYAEAMAMTFDHQPEDSGI